MEEATSRCSGFLEALCSQIDITLEPSMYFVVGTGVVSGLVTALSIGLLLPEAPVIAAGIGMAFLTGAAMGPVGLGNTVVHAVQKEQDNHYRFLLMELVKWIGVPAATKLEFLNAYTHERAIDERLKYLGFGDDQSCTDPSRWTSWEDEVPGLNGALLTEDLFGKGKPYDRATRGCMSAIARRVEMVRQIHRIRRLIVEETVVALVGTQDAGKTTAARRLFPHVQREFPRRGDGGGVVRRGMFEHTVGVRIFPQGRVAVSDFPGSDSTALGLDQAMRRFGGVASVALLFCHFNGDASGEVLRNLEEIKEWSARIPVLLCIHQAGNKVNSDPDMFLFNDELTCVEDVERFVERWRRTVQARFPGLKIASGVGNGGGGEGEEREVEERKGEGEGGDVVVESKSAVGMGFEDPLAMEKDGKDAMDSLSSLTLNDPWKGTAATKTEFSLADSAPSTAVVATASSIVSSTTFANTVSTTTATANTTTITSTTSTSTLVASTSTSTIASTEPSPSDSSPGLTVAMTEFAKELPLCRSFGIWGVREVRRWIRERIAESNGFIRMEDLLEILPDADE
ncbi:hypothetical protein HDU76_006840 [Blyttiomyces sp. JEL0837]|nr:hypothetical protein HDU76_006840 [Blyttiomyces sp. JEL0837]